MEPTDGGVPHRDPFLRGANIPWSQQYNHQLAEQCGRAEMQQQLVQCQQAMAAMQHQLATMNAASIKKQRQQKQAIRRSVSPPAPILAKRRTHSGGGPTLS